MARVQRLAKKTARMAGKTMKSAGKTATRIAKSAAVTAAAKGVVGVIGRRPRSKKGKVALAIGLTAAAIAINKVRKARRG